MKNGKHQIGIDIGGTFTDVVILDPKSDRLKVGKKLTSSDRPAQAVLQVMDQMLKEEGIEAQTIGKIIHGTTLVTNLIIERKGASTHGKSPSPTSEEDFFRMAKVRHIKRRHGD